MCGELDEEYYDDDCPCNGCNEDDHWECQCCVAYHDWIGDDDFDPFDI